MGLSSLGVDYFFWGWFLSSCESAGYLSESVGLDASTVLQRFLGSFLVFCLLAECLCSVFFKACLPFSFCFVRWEPADFFPWVGLCLRVSRPCISRSRCLPSVDLGYSVWIYGLFLSEAPFLL